MVVKLVLNSIYYDERSLCAASGTIRLAWKWVVALYSQFSQYFPPETMCEKIFKVAFDVKFAKPILAFSRRNFYLIFLTFFFSFSYCVYTQNICFRPDLRCTLLQSPSFYYRKEPSVENYSIQNRVSSIYLLFLLTTKTIGWRKSVFYLHQYFRFRWCIYF